MPENATTPKLDYGPGEGTVYLKVPADRPRTTQELHALVNRCAEQLPPGYDLLGCSYDERASVIRAKGARSSRHSDGSRPKSENGERDGAASDPLTKLPLSALCLAVQSWTIYMNSEDREESIYAQAQIPMLRCLMTPAVREFFDEFTNRRGY